MAVRLPKPGYLPVTGPVDAIDRYYTPIIGPLFRSRLDWAELALPDRPLERVLEIGYGSGVFQYTLAPRARVSVGIDIHPQAAEVRRRLADDGVRADLLRGDGCELPFADASFDVVVVLSALEFVPDPARCLAEAVRVLAPGGRVICVCPRRLPWADTLYKQLVGFDPEQEFQGGRQRVQTALQTVDGAIRRHPRPAWLPSAVAPYELIVIEPSPASAPLAEAAGYG